MDWSQIATIAVSVITTVSGVIFAAKKLGAERQVSIYDQIQEDLAELRREFAAHRKYADGEFAYFRSLTAHLENEVVTLREAWPPESSRHLPPRKPYPPRSSK